MHHKKRCFNCFVVCTCCFFVPCFVFKKNYGQDFINKCLDKDPLKRPTVDELIEEDEFVGLKNVVFGWRKERIIWIGYHKNENNPSCQLIKLPKDLVYHIISFIKLDYYY